MNFHVPDVYVFHWQGTEFKLSYVAQCYLFLLNQENSERKAEERTEHCHAFTQVCRLDVVLRACLISEHI